MSIASHLSCFHMTLSYAHLEGVWGVRDPLPLLCKLLVYLLHSHSKLTENMPRTSPIPGKLKYPSPLPPWKFFFGSAWVDFINAKVSDVAYWSHVFNAMINCILSTIYDILWKLFIFYIIGWSLQKYIEINWNQCNWRDFKIKALTWMN